MATGTAGTGVSAGTTTVVGRALALGRAELRLLGRNRVGLYTALMMPFLMIYALRSATKNANLSATGMSLTEVTMTGAFGYVLLFVVHTSLITVYTARRQELVLKRLRTSEAGDAEILAGTALPSAAIALAQCVLLVVVGSLWLHMRAPARPELLVAGMLSGIVMLAALAAVFTRFTKTSESSQLTALPFVMLSLVFSGIFWPLESMPDGLATFCEVLPMTPVLQLVRAGWLGGAGTGEALGHLGAALAWTVVAVFAVRRWFRWEPRH
ncbi:MULTISPECIES: ABC transporter permease [Streptomyces]|uniref:Transport permease protein n=1 Tax=Streptomyces morookaense TaxID=1970 RepID=A0A7Y7EAZ3_STRMO|nr:MULTISPECIES: ABC transporter permease [Streptomyces]MCC2275162.1 ABC transporter permease [Streptomyces sp. ET3-23]NVK82593.1 ABC transporter permease [Streptomyces morookaense]GHF25447.1 transport permease protein [Streptomyces morookaense]